MDLGFDVNLGVMSIVPFEFVEEKAKGPSHDTDIERQ